MPRLFSPRHPAPEFIGHTGSAGSWLFYCPGRQILLAGAVNQVTAAAVPFRIAPRTARAFV